MCMKCTIKIKTLLTNFKTIDFELKFKSMEGHPPESYPEEMAVVPLLEIIRILGPEFLLKLFSLDKIFSSCPDIDPEIKEDSQFVLKADDLACIRMRHIKYLINATKFTNLFEELENIGKPRIQTNPHSEISLN